MISPFAGIELAFTRSRARVRMDVVLALFAACPLAVGARG
jgi:hypothetical protein